MGFDFERMLRHVEPVPQEKLDAIEAAREISLRGEMLNRSGATAVLTADGMHALITDELKDTQSLRAVRRWLSKAPRKPFLIMMGSLGVGKTLAASYAIVVGGGRYVTMSEFTRLFSSRWREDYAKAQKLVKSSALLVVDELGIEDDKHASDALHFIVDNRQRGKTIFVGNLGFDQFKTRYDPRTLDRLRPAANAVELTGESLRGAA